MHKDIKKLVKDGILEYDKKNRDYVLTKKAKEHLEKNKRIVMYRMILESAQNNTGWVN